MRVETPIRRFFGDEGGATAIEYGLIATLIALVVITGLTATGGAVTLLYQKIAQIATALL